MSYKSIKDCQKYLSVNSEDKCNALYDAYIEHVRTLPQVASGAVSTETAENWLKEVVRIVEQPYIGSIIKKSSGFTPEEVSALYRYENNDYRPVLHASEVYSAKNLLSVDLTGHEITSEGLIRDDSSLAAKQIAIAATRNHIGELENHDLRAQLINNTNSQIPWAIINPPMIVSNEENHIIVEVNAKLPKQVNERTSFEATLGDKIRLNYQAAVMQMSGIKTPPNLQQVVFIKAKELMDEQVQTLKAIGLFNKDGINRVSQVENLPIKNFQVNYDAELARELVKIGNKHWANIAVKGVEPDFKQSIQNELPASIVVQRNELARKVFTIGMMKQTLDAADSEARQNLKAVDSINGITSQHAGISKLVGIVEHTKIDYTALMNELSLKGVDRSSFMVKEYDSENMAKAASQGIINPLDFIVYKEVDKNKILTTAELLDINIAQFSYEDNRLNISGDTRGPLHRCKNEIKEVAQNNLDRLIDHLSEHQALHSKAVFGVDERRKEKAQPENSATQQVSKSNKYSIGM